MVEGDFIVMLIVKNVVTWDLRRSLHLEHQKPIDDPQAASWMSALQAGV